MSKSKYTNAQDDIADAINSAEMINDFLPPPEYFTESLVKEKISLYVDAKALAQYRAYAKDHGVKYQALINQVLSNYANKRLRPIRSKTSRQHILLSERLKDWKGTPAEPEEIDWGGPVGAEEW